MRWTFRTLGAVVDDEILALPPDMQARLLHLGELIEQSGLQSLSRDSVKHLDGKLWELRISGRDGIARAIYVTAAAGASLCCVYLSKRHRRRQHMNWISPDGGPRR